MRETVELFPISERDDKVSVGQFGTPEASISECFPNVLAGKDFWRLVGRMVVATKDCEDIVFFLGAHVVKCGCSPFIIEMMRRGTLTHVAMNGGAMIHDYELAMFGSTSESVEDNLPMGKFGMWEESYKILELPGEDPAVPLGSAVGRAILCKVPPAAAQNSLLAEAFRNHVSTSVHTAIGADFIHDPGKNLMPLVRGLIADLEIFDNIISSLSKHAVVINFGSAVILPEVWLKALSRAVNKGKDFSGITCANFDMKPSYRQIEQIVKRPKLLGATTYSFIGHHEIMIPLLIKAVLE